MSTTEVSAPAYTIRRVTHPPPFDQLPHDEPWRAAPVAEISRLWAKSQQRAAGQARVLCDDWGVYVGFTCEERYAVARQIDHQAPVYEDSAVEWFVQPRPDAGYFNFELNCGGAMLLYHVSAVGQRRKRRLDSTPVKDEWLREIRIQTSLPRTVDEADEITAWRLMLGVPYAFFEHHLGPVDRRPGAQWRCNFQKVKQRGQGTHWLTWAPLERETSFHRPASFAPLIFGE